MAARRAPLLAVCLAAALTIVDAVTIACAGDSVTYGMHGQDKNDLPTTGGSWPAWLEHHLEKTQEYAPDHFTVLNLGRSGATAQRQTDRPYRETEEYTQLLASNYDLAIITLGTNDAKRAFWDEARYAAEYVALIDAVRRANPGGEIALGLPVARGVPQKGNKGEWHDKSVINVDVQKIVREVAAAAGVTLLVDFFGALGGIEPDPDLHPRRVESTSGWRREIRSPHRYHDKIHPNDAGYEKLGLEALETVAEFEAARQATSGPTPRPSTREPTVTPADDITDDAPEEEPVADAPRPTAKPTPRVVAAPPDDDTPPPKPMSSSSSSSSDGPPVAAAAALAVLAVIGILAGYLCRKRLLRRPPPPPSIDSPMEKGDKGAYALTALRSPPKPRCKNPLFMSPPPSERGPPPPPDGLRSRKSSDEPAQRLSFEEPTSPLHRPVVEEEDDAPLDDVDDPRSPLTPSRPAPAPVARAPAPPLPDPVAAEPTKEDVSPPPPGERDAPPPPPPVSPPPARKSDAAGGLLSPATRDLWRKMTGRK